MSNDKPAPEVDEPSNDVDQQEPENVNKPVEEPVKTEPEPVIEKTKKTEDIERYKANVSDLQKKYNESQKRLERLEQREATYDLIETSEIPEPVKNKLKVRAKEGALTTGNFESVSTDMVDIYNVAIETVKAEQTSRVANEPSKTPPKDFHDKLTSASDMDSIKELYNSIPGK